MKTDKQIKLLIHQLVISSLPIEAMRGLDNRFFIPGKSPIQYAGPTWDNRELEAAIYALLRGKWLCGGNNTAEFENRFSQIINKKFSIMCNSGSSANLLMMSALKSKRTYGLDGAEVITPVVCFPTTVAPIIQLGFKPKFIDVEMDSLNLDLNLLEKSITKKTKILIFAHVLGNPPNMDRLIKICQAKNIILLEDACDALGSTWGNKPLGSFGLMSSHSFYPAHHITTAEGGMVSTNDTRLADTLRSLVWWGRACTCVGAVNYSITGACGHRFDKWLSPKYKGILDHKYVYKEVGYNLKPLDLQGAIGLIQLKKLKQIKIARQKNFNRFYHICNRYPQLIKLALSNRKANVNWFGFPITVITDKFTRNDFVKFLEQRNIQTRDYFSGNLLFHPPFAHLGNPYEFPHACQVMERTFFIGVHSNMSNEMVNYVCQSLNEFLKRYR
ncbi:MAG: DegT/DnrJ/EryC1/StrS family aminotransferase [Candidatus Gottesmanbacteria bacterium]